MIHFLVRRFVKDYEHMELAQVRTGYGILASVVGILCNLLLFAGKFTVGLLLHSVSVLADAFNNLSDAASSIIGFVGVKMASKPADQDHPFGHGRIEYVTAFVVAFLVIEIGISFFKSSLGKIREPEELVYSTVSVIILLFSMGVKFWLSYFNRVLGKRIHSGVMMATAADAMGDVFATGATVFSIVYYRFTGMNIDGYVGLLVSLVVMWAGIGIARDTLEPLIGAAGDPEMYRQLTEFVEKYEGILGSHDLIVHTYGPTKSIASIHAEVSNHMDIETAHELIDRIERDVNRELGIFLVIHMDPLETEDHQLNRIKTQVQQVLSMVDRRLTLHDFRMAEKEERINLFFDVVVPYSYTEDDMEELRGTIIKKICRLDSRYCCVLILEKSYVAEKNEKK